MRYALCTILTFIFSTSIAQVKIADSAWQETKLLNRRQKLSLMWQLDNLFYNVYASEVFQPKLIGYSDREALQDADEISRLVSTSSVLIFDDLTPNFDGKTVIEQNKTISRYYLDALDFFQNDIDQPSYLGSDSIQYNSIDTLEIDLWNALKDDRVIDISGGEIQTSLIQKRIIEYKLQSGRVIRNEPISKIDLSFSVSSDSTISDLSISSIEKVASQYFYKYRKPLGIRPIIAVGFSNPGLSYNEVSDFSLSDRLTLSQAYVKTAGIEFIKNEWLVFGLRYHLHSGTLFTSSYNASFDDIDNDLENYIKNVSISNLEEKYSIGFIEIPILYQPKFDFLPKQLTVSLGASISFELHHKAKADGIFTFNGFYPQYNATLSDIERLGFVTEEPLSMEVNNMDLNRLNFGYEISIGWNFNHKNPIVSSNIRLIHSGMVTNLSKGDFHIVATGVDQYGGLIPVSNSSRFSSWSIQYGLTIQKDKKYLKTRRANN